jgi:hypothetical protein
MHLKTRRANAVGDSARRLIPSRFGTGDEDRELVFVVWAVGPNCRNDESQFGAFESAGGDLVLGRIIAHRIVDQRVHDAVRRRAGIQCVTNLVSCLDEAWHAFDGGDAFIIEQRQKFVVVRVSRCCTAAQNCNAAQQRNGGNRNADMAGDASESGGAGEHERTSVLQ